MNKSRAEAFSDGVLAVAITLLVLDLHVASGSGHAPLGRQLREQWPTFASFVVSFFLIGVIWINHHAMFVLVDRVDRVVLAYNLLLLLAVSTIPFTTATLADFLQAGGSDSHWAVVLYGISMELMAISFTLILNRMITHGLLIVPVTRSVGRRAVIRYGLGAFVFPVTVLVGLWSPQVMLAIYALVVVYYVFEQTPIVPGEPVTDV